MMILLLNGSRSFHCRKVSFRSSQNFFRFGANLIVTNIAKKICQLISPAAGIMLTVSTGYFFLRYENSTWILLRTTTE